MIKPTILNKLKLLDIRQPWQVSIVKELSKRRGASAAIGPLFRDTNKRMKTNKVPGAKNKFNHAIFELLKHELLFERYTTSGRRIHLLMSVWQIEDAVINSIAVATKKFSQGRKINIRWKTILKEVRKNLAVHEIKLPYQVTQTLVRYFLGKRCGWKLQDDFDLLPPKCIIQRLPKSPEQQHDLFL